MSGTGAHERATAEETGRSGQPPAEDAPGGLDRSNAFSLMGGGAGWQVARHRQPSRLPVPAVAVERALADLVPSPLADPRAGPATRPDAPGSCGRPRRARPRACLPDAAGCRRLEHLRRQLRRETHSGGSQRAPRGVPVAFTVLTTTLVLVAPLLLFTPRLIATKQRALAEYRAAGDDIRPGVRSEVAPRRASARGTTAGLG